MPESKKTTNSLQDDTSAPLNSATSSSIESPIASINNDSVTSKSLIGKFAALVNQSHLRFGWFVANLVTVIAGGFYLLTFFKSAGYANTFWYKMIFAGSLTTFGIVVHQAQILPFGANKNKVSIRSILQNDNVHYFYNALIWLLIPFKITTLAIIPFLSFSIFHVLTFAADEILPLFDGKFNGLNQKLKTFITDYHNFSRKASASSEIILLFYLLLNSVFWRRYSWITLFLYSIFIKVKSEGSIFTRTELKNWEVRVDGVVSSDSVPPLVKQQWGKLKRAIKSLNKYNIIDSTATSDATGVSPVVNSKTK